MTDRIYVVNPSSKEPVKVNSVSFAQIGIKERGDLEEWVKKQPDLLGEDLLITPRSSIGSTGATSGSTFSHLRRQAPLSS